MRYMNYYHGTSTVFGRLTKILPACETNNKREDFRVGKDNFIWLTISPISAYRYAQKCCKKFGGEPVVYLCTGDNIISQNNTEFISLGETVIGCYYELYNIAC